MPNHEMNGSGPSARTVARHGRSSLVAVAVAAALTAALNPADVRAQQAPEAKSTALEEIIVTARKREESVQDVPITINVLSGDALADQGVERVRELQFAVPGFYVQNYETRATITMRGVGAQIEGGTSAVATHINGVYIASAAAQLNRLIDVERVEVLKGPQGTLYGRNSTGGALNILTRMPGDQFDANATLGYGTYDTVRADGAMTIPVGDGWGLRLAASYANGNGQFVNVLDDKKIGEEDFIGGRMTLAGDAGPVRVEAFAQYAEDKNSTSLTLIPVNVATGKPVLGWDRTAFDVPSQPDIKRTPLLMGLTLSGDINDQYSWRSITGYLDYDEKPALTDVNPSATARLQIFIDFPQAAKQFSQELQLLYTGARANWVLGGYYLDDKQSSSRYAEAYAGGMPINFVLLDSQSEDKAKAYAAFFDANYLLTDQLRLNAGVRFNQEDITNRFSGQGAFDGAPFNLSRSDGEPTGRIGLDYTFSPSLMVYGSVSNGYQAGFSQNRYDAVSGNEEPSKVAPEKILAFEVGMKSQLPGGRGFFNVAGFYYDYRDMQVQVGGIFLLPDGNPDPNQPPFFYTDNAGKSRIYGIDLQLTELRIAEHLKFDLAAEYLDAKYQEYDTVNNDQSPVSYKGNTLPRAPDFSGTAAATVDNLHFGTSAKGSLRLEYNYRGKTYFTPNNNPVASQDAFGLLNLYARMDFADGRWGISAVGRNLADKKFYDFRREDNIANTGEFRTWGLAVNYSFQ
jgi:iron complex outermembrane receptor protein